MHTHIHHHIIRPRRLLLVLALALVAALLIAPGATSATTVWLRQFGTVDFDTASSIGVDGDGDLYVAGYTSGTLYGPTGRSSNYTQSYLRKYTSDGTLLWARDTTQQLSFHDTSATDLAVDASGTTYVVGTTNIDPNGQFVLGQSFAYVSSYDSDGALKWTHTFGAEGTAGAGSVALDGSGHLYMGGYVTGSLDGQPAFGGLDLFLRKYTVDGTPVWTRQIGAAGVESSGGVALDSTGAIYLSGQISGAVDDQIYAGGYSDAFVSKYSADGERLWTRLLGNVTEDAADGIAINGDDQIYIAGRTSASLDNQLHAGGYDAFVSKYSTDGTREWTRLLGSAEGDWIRDAAVDESGNLYVSGSTYGDLAGQRNAGEADIFISKFDPSGRGLWTFVQGTDQRDSGFGLAVGAQSELYLVGWTEGTLDAQPNQGSADSFVSRVLNPALTARNYLPLAPR